MRKHTALWSFLFFAVTVFCASSAWAHKKGDMVLAPWGGAFYQATIAAIKGDKADVNYVDGDKATVKLADCKVIANPKKITVGMTVLAKWGAHSYYKAKVLKVNKKDVDTEFLDDKSKRTVPTFKIFKY